MTADRPLIISDRARFTDLGDGTSVVMHFDHKEYFTLNETGTAIWCTLRDQGACTASELVEAMTKLYDVDEAVAREEVLRFVEEMRAHGMLAEAAASD